MRDHNSEFENPYQSPTLESIPEKTARSTRIRSRIPPMRFIWLSPFALLLVVWLLWLVAELQYFLAQLNH